MSAYISSFIEIPRIVPAWEFLFSCPVESVLSFSHFDLRVRVVRRTCFTFSTPNNSGLLLSLILVINPLYTDREISRAPCKPSCILYILPLSKHRYDLYLCIYNTSDPVTWRVFFLCSTVNSLVCFFPTYPNLDSLTLDNDLSA